MTGKFKLQDDGQSTSMLASGNISKKSETDGTQASATTVEYKSNTLKYAMSPFCIFQDSDRLNSFRRWLTRQYKVSLLNFTSHNSMHGNTSKNIDYKALMDGNDLSHNEGHFPAVGRGVRSLSKKLHLNFSDRYSPNGCLFSYVSKERLVNLKMYNGFAMPERSSSIGCSRSVKTVTVGPEGARIEFDDCVITIPAGALSEPTELEFELRIDYINCPKDHLCITPQISQNKPGVKFLKPIYVELSTWCVSESIKENSLVVLYNSGKDTDWKVTKTVAVLSGSKIRLEISQFSTYVIGIWRRLLGYLGIHFKMRSVLFHQNFINFSATCGFDNAAIINAYTNNFNSSGWKTVFPKLNPITCLMNDCVNIKLSSNTPGISFDPPLGQFYKADEDDFKTSYFTCEREKIEDPIGMIQLKYTVKNKNRDSTTQCHLYIPAPSEIPIPTHDEERMEDAFISICERFSDADSFKTFAISRHGLCLQYRDVRMICDSETHFSNGAMCDVLALWQQKNKNKVSAPMLRSLVDNYFVTPCRDNPEASERKMNTQQCHFQLLIMICFVAAFCITSSHKWFNC